MTDNAVHPAEEEWGWVGRRLGEEGGCLTFVHGVGVEHLLTAYGMDAAAATMVTLDQALGRYPERQAGGEPVPWVRVGVSGDWTFAVETDSFLGSTSVVGPASEGTRAAVVHWTPKPNHWVAYYEDGTCVIEFEPRMEWSLGGSDPGRFQPQLRELGILERPPPPPRLPSGKRDIEAIRRQYRNPALQGLSFLTLAFGIRVPEATATGPLLTCQRSANPA